MTDQPELPRPLAFLIASGVSAAPNSGNVSIQDVVPMLSTWIFPQPLPPLQIVAILLGGIGIYTTKFRILGPSGQSIKTVVAPDIAFTTQVTRVNLLYPLQGISAEPIVTEPGTYQIELLIRNMVVARTPLPISALPGPPPGFPIQPPVGS
jgi:hypothetical protein